ncbi:MAG TPA: hypothetical protein VMA37_14510 [Acetobacteraceae bacterium]|nr:hypothetical protein [Acetobacteraceae bacterium]
MNGSDELAATSDRLGARMHACDPLSLSKMGELAMALLKSARAWQRTQLGAPLPAPHPHNQ